MLLLLENLFQSPRLLAKERLLLDASAKKDALGLQGVMSITTGGSAQVQELYPVGHLNSTTTVGMF